MKDLSHQLSPIHYKYPKRQIYCPETTQNIQLPHYGHHDNHLSVIDTLNWHHFDYKINSAAKNILYVVIPDSQLFERVGEYIHNYDKFKKIRLIIKELIAGLNDGKMVLENEIVKMQEKMDGLEKEIWSLKGVIRTLEQECLNKDKQNQKMKGNILELTQAYELAKKYHQQELNELRKPLPELKINIKEIKQNHSSKGKTDREPYPNVPRPKKSQGYTDRSMYKRFSVSPRGSEEDGSPKNNSKQAMQQHAAAQKIASLQFEKEALERKLHIVQTQFSQLASQFSNNMKKQEQEHEKSKLDVEQAKAETAQFRKKLVKKNQVIQQLLAVIEGKQPL